MNPVGLGEKTIAIEMFFKDVLLWNKTEISIANVGMHIDGHSTKKLSYRSNNKTIYYTRTIVKLKRSSLSLPYYLYFTVHIGDLILMLLHTQVEVIWLLME